MTVPERVRQFAFERHVEPARAAGLCEISIRLGDIQRSLDLDNPMQTVRSALLTKKFERKAGVELLSPRVRRPQADTRCRFRILKR